MRGVRTATLVAGTAAAVGLTLANDRRLKPAFVEATPIPRLPSLNVSALSRSGVAAGSLSDVRTFVLRNVGIAMALAFAFIMIAASLPAISTFASGLRSSSAPVPAVALGPSSDLRAASDLGGNWEQSYSRSVPSTESVRGAVWAAAQDQHSWDVLQALNGIAEQRAAAQAAASAPRPNPASTLNRPSGYPAGTILRSRITVYGCTGPGGGFCNNMASGVAVFEGAAACSSDLPFGTKVKIAGDPTGRVYECLDRGALPATWVDVYFHNTSDGIAWQGLLGGTVTDIEIVN